MAFDDEVAKLADEIRMEGGRLVLDKAQRAGPHEIIQVGSSSVVIPNANLDKQPDFRLVQRNVLDTFSCGFTQDVSLV